MTQDEVLQLPLEVFGKIHNRQNFAVNNGCANGDVSHQASFVGVGKSFLVTQLINLPEIMKRRSDHQRMGVEHGIKASHRLRDSHQLLGVGEKTTEVGMVDGFRCGADLITGRDLGIAALSLIAVMDSVTESRAAPC